MEGDKEYAEALTAKRGGQCIFADYIYGYICIYGIACRCCQIPDGRSLCGSGAGPGGR